MSPTRGRGPSRRNRFSEVCLGRSDGGHAYSHLWPDSEDRTRAAMRSITYAVADSPEQAVEDLVRSWAQSRRIGWAIDSGAPAPRGGTAVHTTGVDRRVSASLRHAHLVAERQAAAAVVPADRDSAYYQAERRVRRLERALEDLDKAEGRGAWRYSCR